MQRMPCHSFVCCTSDNLFCVVLFTSGSPFQTFVLQDGLGRMSAVCPFPIAKHLGLACLIFVHAHTCPWLCPCYLRTIAEKLSLRHCVILMNRFVPDFLLHTKKNGHNCKMRASSWAQAMGPLLTWAASAQWQDALPALSALLQQHVFACLSLSYPKMNKTLLFAYQKGYFAIALTKSMFYLGVLLRMAARRLNGSAIS